MKLQRLTSTHPFYHGIETHLLETILFIMVTDFVSLLFTVIANFYKPLGHPPSARAGCNDSENTRYAESRFKYFTGYPGYT